MLSSLYSLLTLWLYSLFHTSSLALSSFDLPRLLFLGVVSFDGFFRSKSSIMETCWPEVHKPTIGYNGGTRCSNATPWSCPFIEKLRVPLPFMKTKITEMTSPVSQVSPYYDWSPNLLIIYPWKQSYATKSRTVFSLIDGLELLETGHTPIRQSPPLYTPNSICQICLPVDIGRSIRLWFITPFRLLFSIVLSSINAMSLCWSEVDQTYLPILSLGIPAFGVKFTTEW